MRNLHRRFGLCSASQIYGGDFAKFCGLLRIFELYFKEKMFNRITAKSGQVPLDSKCKSLMKLYRIYCDFLIVYFLCVVSNYDHECHFSKLLHHRTLFAFANFNSVSYGQIKILKLIIGFNELTKKNRIKKK